MCVVGDDGKVLIICHTPGVNSLHPMCVVGDDGKVTRSYGGHRGFSIRQLKCPHHLAVDKGSQFIFVADLWNDRVVLLSPTLEFVRYVSTLMYSHRKLL